MSDDELRKIWRTAGGSFHGPNIETGTMPESQLLPFLRSLSTIPSPISDQAALIAAAEKYVSAYADDERDCIRIDVLNAFYQGAKFQRSAAAPTQDADAQPVAIYQVRVRGDDKWSDVLEGVYDSCHRLHSHKFETRIVHESLPSDCEPVGEIVTFGKDPEVKEVSWAKGKMPSVGTKLYATRNAAPKDSNRARGASIPQHEIAYALHVASGRTKSIVACHAIVNAALATRDAAPSDVPKEDAKRLKQLEHALVYVAHSMHSEPQYMLAEGITLGDVSFVRVKIADIDVSVDLPESVARAMYDAAMQATATKDEERRIAIAASAPREETS